jgi:hypothetical protein
VVEIKCPACGAEGRAKKEYIQTRLVCRKCLRVFHVTLSGKAVPGEPPVTGQTSNAGSYDAVAPDRTQKVDQWFDRASKRLFSPTSLILAVGLVLIAMATALFSNRRPETLHDRVAMAARAAVQRDLRTVRELAAAGTEIDVDSWYLSIRSKCDDLLQQLGSKKLAVETEVRQLDPAKERAEVVAHVSIEEDLQRKGINLPDASITVMPTGPTLSLPMAWNSEGWAGWRLDGKRTQELSKPRP